ncbi:sensor histidine kinase [Haloactinomyces albus]|uniref:histidine kinase n=1 Tax=Haloactinomyces albus TaxID=1352928 RepID=A0AAE3ZAW1_9ACTN|nr:nitrate- and nitrite sensing domain-containing protein [Haloactinomyces albus]MDR7301533.1 anti-sigma regulatory factor (Ser/Thr protein kinase) [Haloactinomyces albus]
MPQGTDVGPMGGRNTGRGWAGMRSIRNWRLRTKLLVVLLVPSIAALALGVFQVHSAYTQVQALAGNSRQVELHSSVLSVMHELQRERDLTVSYIASGRTADRTELDKQRAAVDRAISRFRSDIERVQSGSYPEVADRFHKAASSLDRLASLRQVTDNTQYPADAALRAYTSIVDSLLHLGEQDITRIDNPEVVRLVLAASAMSHVEEQESTKRALLAAVLHGDGFDAGEQREFLAADAALQAALHDFRKWATPAQLQSYNDIVSGLAVDRASTIEETALVRARSDSTAAQSGTRPGSPVTQSDEALAGLSTQEWLQTSTETVNLTHRMSRQLHGQLQDRVDALAGEARTRMYLAAGLVLGALVLAFAIALMVGRSLLLPLRTLRRSALDVADNRLPEAVDSILDESDPDTSVRGRIEPIPVHTEEEIGRVARSFDAVHSQALRLASEQALLRNNVNDLFVNLARRSQTLVQRQLSLIERLEQDEQDPDQLSSLFELDHLATRMRRNNENLLILGGTDLTRRTMRPVPLTEVVGAAVSEVEQYARIAIADAPELAIQGRIVNDVVHLIAELLENATVFSNPDTEVTVRTVYRKQELVLEIRDRGVGIDSEELSDINDRLTRPPDVDVAVSRRMGLYVVGQLSRRHDIGVELQNNEDLEGGITATVRLSGQIVVQLTPDGPMPMPDIQHAPSGEQRDPLSDTGAHGGLAAAFGRDGIERAPVEPPTEMAMPVGGDARTSAEEPVEDSWPQDSWPQDSWPELEEIGEPANQYSVHVSSGSSYGVADVPHWDATSDVVKSGGDDEFTRDEPVEAEWPSEDAVMDEEVPDALDGQCGVPPGVDDPGNLFHSPFEAEKTTQFARIPAEEERARDVAGAPAPVDNGVQAQDPADNTWSKGVARDMDDAPTERLPIYEAVLSQWFRESDEDDNARPMTRGSSREEAGNFDSSAPSAPAERPNNGSPVSQSPPSRDAVLDQDTAMNMFGGPAGFEVEPDEFAARNGTGWSPAEETPSWDPFAARNGHSGRNGSSVLPDPAEESAPNGSALPSNVPEGPRVGRRAATREQRDRVAQARQAAEPGWGAGDAGWQAAEALLEQDEQEQETTSAGLPKRKPQSNLVPGSAAPQPQSPPPSRPTSARSADAVRGRMSNFQQGVQRGRHAKTEESASTEQSHSIPSRHEEQE